MLDNANYKQLAAQASTAAGRRSPWKGDAITKFRQGSAVTRELANALSTVLGVAIPFWEAVSEKEALEFEVVRSRNAQVTDGQPTPDKGIKRARVVEALEQAVSATTDQTRPVASKDERSPRGSGHRSASSRRKTSARS
jgi:hypothetical protein